MNRYRLTYIPRGVNAPAARDVLTLTIYALDARHAAVRAQSFERRSGARVLTVKESK
jgi:hypothetical protein